MKKILLFLLPVILWSCGGGEVNKSPIRLETERLMQKYPNYKSNSEARNLLIEEVNRYGESFVGKEAPFKDIEFSFLRIITNDQTGAKSALLKSNTFAEIDNPNQKGKYIIADAQICVLGIIPQDVAITLDSNLKYSVQGVVKAYDENDPFYVGDWTFGIYFGTFILNDMQLNVIPQ